MKPGALLKRRRARIEMIPLIDVVFLLLVFFIYAMISMTTHRGMKVVLPRTVSGSHESRLPITVTITSSGTVEVEGQPVRIDELAAAVALLRAERGEVPVLISGDKDAPLGAAIGVLDTLSTAGISKVTFLTEGKSTE